MPSSGFQLSALPEITATPAANAGVYDPQQSMKAMEAAIALFKQLQNAPAQQEAEQSGFNLQTTTNKAKTPIQGVLAGAQGAEYSRLDFKSQNTRIALVCYRPQTFHKIFVSIVLVEGNPTDKVFWLIRGRRPLLDQI